MKLINLIIITIIVFFFFLTDFLIESGLLFEPLIPIRLDMEFDGIRYKENILWNLKDNHINPEMFARMVC